MPYWNFEYTKAVIYTVVKVGGGIGQDPATEVTHLRLNQPPVFPVYLNSFRKTHSKVKTYRLYLYLTFSGLKQLILDQTKQNGYQTVPFSVYIYNLMFVFTLE